MLTGGSEEASGRRRYVTTHFVAPRPPRRQIQSPPNLVNSCPLNLAILLRKMIVFRQL